jgi:hypothetical protein
LRGIPRSAPIFVRTPERLKRVTMVRLIRVSADGQHTEGGDGETGIVLKA